MEEITKTTIVKRYNLITPNDVKMFTWSTSECKGDVACIADNSRNIDAKSILGLFSLDLSKPITVVFEDVYGNEEFFEELRKWEVK